MASLQDTLIETISKDLKDLGSLESGKDRRKECSLLLARIESAKKIMSTNESLMKKLSDFQLETESLKNG
ncbi:hypothetical protein A9Q84_00650 [Halobacteriovorax marinus]|uniref:Uncharacterized protein n=1 Tax=Halobacteriovorax marinus TaxID=97084 RepID=A0A1Y5FBH8_9BACT|nr:hypothetical protein A9Q84_00650 [Halobacteriovorax marinus]